jgi:AraC family transcriptional regulator
MPHAAFRFDLSVYSPGCCHPPHAHDQLHLSLALRGRIAERVGDTIEHAGALSAVVKDPGVTHADEFGRTGAVMARLVIPEHRFADLVPDKGDAPAWAWTHDPAAATPFLRLVERAARGQKVFSVDDGDVVDLLAAFAPAPAGLARGVPPRWLRLVMEQLHDADSANLTVRDLARSAEVHPVYLARAVRRWYGTSPAAELRRARLRRAADAIAHRAGTATSIAHRTGFSDQPHLCRVFSKATGLTPGHYSRLVSRIQGSARRTA